MVQPAIIDGWVSFCEHQPSPHHNERPPNTAVDVLVIHNISLPPGQFGSNDIRDFFLGNLVADKHPFFKQIVDLRVSAHFVIYRGGRVIQFVSTDMRAWHAGVSSFKGRDGCNDFSIGIEMEGTDDTPYSDEQYASLTRLTMTLQQHYPKISVTNITGHSDIAPGRKTDPGPAFDWSRYLSSLTESK